MNSKKISVHGHFKPFPQFSLLVHCACIIQSMCTDISFHIGCHDDDDDDYDDNNNNNNNNNNVNVVSI